MPPETINWPVTETAPTTALLIRARGFIERGWCRNALARDREDQYVHPTSKNAVAWCASGALFAAGLSAVGFFHPRHPAVNRLKVAIGDENIPDYNNRQESVEPVLAAFDRAIAASDTP